MERMHSQGGVYRGVLSLQSGRQIEQQKEYKNIMRRGLRWPPFDILPATTNQKHADVTEGGWDRTRDWVETLWERDSILLGLLSVPKHDPLKYS